MRYCPLKSNNKAIVMSIICSVAAVVLFVSSAFVHSFGALYQITAIILAVISLHLYLKYIACEYVYEACENDLKIYKTTGKKSICVASLSYAASKSRVMNLREYTLLKNNMPKYSYTVNYAKNLYPEQYCLYYFDFNGKTVRMKFEPDDVFAEYINKHIEKTASI